MLNIGDTDAELVKEKELHSRWTTFRTELSAHFDTKGYECHMPIKPPVMETLPHAYWIQGPTGTGKSYVIRQRHVVSDDVFDRMLGKGFYNGYHGQSVVHIEDVNNMNNKEQELFARELKQLGDRYPFQVDMKNQNEMWCRPLYVYVTSQYSMREIFDRIDKRDVDAIMRRFKVIVWDNNMRRNVENDLVNEVDRRDDTDNTFNDNIEW